MSDNNPAPLHRREFLQTGVLASAAALTLGSPSLGDESHASMPTLPTRKLGKTGVDVTILNHGTWQAPGSLDRLLRTSYAAGVRYFDTARTYGTEPGIARWLQAMPEVRKNIFLATKDLPRSASQIMGLLDQRLATLKTDYVDLFFVHALGDDDSVSNPIKFAGSRQFGRAIEAIKNSGKARFVGFSTHHPAKAQIIQAAAQGGFVDVIMVSYTPWIERDHPINLALDAAHAKGIGLVSMKQLSGSDADRMELLGAVSQVVPGLRERGLSPYQGLLHAIWSDERIASCCVSMRNLDQIAENTVAAKVFEPLKAAALRGLHRAFLASRPTLCANCDGSCSRAGGTEAELGTLTRFLTYHEHNGLRTEARQRYSKMSDASRSWQGADLEAARAACPSHLDFADLLPRVDRHLA
jgi:aryl-alcohol dehydrogenase-like predicted oxidoreductase